MTLLLAGVVIAVVMLASNRSASPSPPPMTAAIVDQLSLTQPNQEFVARTTRLLRQAGYRVDY